MNSDKAKPAYTDLLMGRCYFFLKKYNLSKELLEQEYTAVWKEKKHEWICDDAIYLSELYSTTGKIDQAEKVLDESYDIIEQNDAAELFRIQLELGKILN